jgi:hypothetical protein
MRTSTQFGTVKILMLKGEQGEQGASGRFEDLTEEQMAELKQDLRAFYKKAEGIYVTTSQGARTIPVPIDGFRSTDILLVDVDGLDLVQGTDYTIDGTSIVLSSPITTDGHVVHFVALRASAVEAEDYALLKGDKGDTGDFSQLTQAEQDEIAEYVGDKALAASLQSLTGSVTTSGSSTRTIAIPINDYADTDILMVAVEGLLLTEGADYTVSNGSITLSEPITHAGTVVSFRTIRGAWGTS